MVTSDVTLKARGLGIGLLFALADHIAKLHSTPARL